MPAISSHVFDLASPASPQQVWAALTTPELTARYLFGMTVDSAWRAGARVVMRLPEGVPDEGTLQGEVLAAEEPSRLSFTVGPGDGHPTTYVTWEIAGADPPMGAHVRLYVDETGAQDGDEAAASWRLVLAAFDRVLASLPLG